VDYTAQKGTPVVSIGDGVVVDKGHQGGSGNFLKVKHNGVYTTQYMHLSGFAKGVYPGTPVKQGQIIGFVGSTGLSTGPHLDFRVYKNGSPVDPLKVEAPPAEPVKNEFRSDYLYVKDSLMRGLYSIRWKN
jgi:murein DD-endopeptidase MepM/ murein hydrolase activator NlpD